MSIRIIPLLLALILAPFAMAVEIVSIDHDKPIQGAISGIDDQKRLLVTPTGTETTIGVRMDGIQELDFGGKNVEPAVEDARFRFVFDDGTALFGDVAALEKDEALDWLAISSLTKGALKTRYDGLTRIERREDAKPGKDLPHTEEEKKTIKAGMEWKLYKSSGDSAFACAELTVYPNKLEYLIDFERDELSSLWKEVRSVVREGSKEPPFTELYAIATSNRGERFVGVVETWKDGTLKLKTRYFGSLDLSEKDLATIIFRNGRFTFVSDMNPSKSDEYPFLRSTEFKPADHLFPYRQDRAQGGGALTLDGKTFAKGLGVHSISRLTYRLDKQFTRFIATIGVDDSAGKKASVVFRVYVDGKEAKMKFTQGAAEGAEKEGANSGIMRKSTKPLTIEVDVLRAQEIILVVEAADNGDVQDRADWASAMLVR